MSDEIKEVEDTFLKLEMAFGSDATRVINEMKQQTQTDGYERLISDSIRVYRWYLENKDNLYAKAEGQLVKVNLEF